jgi:hypothetical protein
MARTVKRPKTLGDVIDQIEKVRDELLAIQSSMETIESADPPEPGAKAERSKP